MSWTRTAQQESRHSDGYVVGNAGRDTVEYLDGDRRALIGIDRGTESSRLYTDSLVWVQDDGTEVPVEPSERATVVDRIVEGLAVYSSSAVERFPPSGGGDPAAVGAV